MPPVLAALVGCCFVCWLLHSDMRSRAYRSPLLLLPALWLGLLGSRPVVLWLDALGMKNPQLGQLLDALAFFGLIVAAVGALAKRKFRWGSFLINNKTLALVYAYLALSAFWSEDELSTLKRCIKDFGSVLMALVLLTEVNPPEAIRLVFVRLAYVLFPASFVLMKWFPSIGRGSFRGHDAMYVGVCAHKSTLGATILVFGLWLIGDILETSRLSGIRWTSRRVWAQWGTVLLGIWLILLCKSMTSLVCFALGCLLLWSGGLLARMRNPSQTLACCLVILLLGLGVEAMFNVSGTLLGALGKNKSLTGRTEIWDDVLAAQVHPVLGSGYWSFWDTEAAADTVAEFQHLRSAHNGFLDMYLDCGMVGVGLLITLLLVWGRNAIRRLLKMDMLGRMTFAFWVIGLIFNNSETAFFRLIPIWFVLILTGIVCLEVREGALFCKGEAR